MHRQQKCLQNWKDISQKQKPGGGFPLLWQNKQTKMYQVCYKVQIHFFGLLEISLLPGFPFLSTSHHTWQWFSYRLSGHNLTQHKFSRVKMQISLNPSRSVTNREIYPNPVLRHFICQEINQKQQNKAHHNSPLFTFILKYVLQVKT